MHRVAILRLGATCRYGIVTTIALATCSVWALQCRQHLPPPSTARAGGSDRPLQVFFPWPASIYMEISSRNNVSVDATPTNGIIEVWTAKGPAARCPRGESWMRSRDPLYYYIAVPLDPGTRLPWQVVRYLVKQSRIICELHCTRSTYLLYVPRSSGFRLLQHPFLQG